METELNTIVYRWLEGDEMVQRLKPVIEFYNWAPLDPRTCRALCAFEGEKIIGFYVSRLIPVIGPGWVDPHVRGGEITKELTVRMMTFMQDNTLPFMAIADSPHVRKICETVGMTEVHSPVFLM